MTTETETYQRSGLSASLRLLAMVTLLALAGLVAGMVLDIIPANAMMDVVIKVAALGGIAAAVAAVFWVLTQPSKG